MLTPVFIHRLLNFVTVSMDEPFEQCIGPCSWKFDLCQDTTRALLICGRYRFLVQLCNASYDDCICVYVCVCLCVCVKSYYL